MKLEKRILKNTAPRVEDEGEDKKGSGMFALSFPLNRTAGRFKVTLIPHTKYKSVWTSVGTLSETPLAIWRPEQISDGPASGWTSVRGTLCTGYAALASFDRPKELKGKIQCLVLQLEDTQSSIFNTDTGPMLRAMKGAFPNPVAYRLVWKSSGDARPVFIWEPVAPFGFACLGSIATETPEEPKVEIMRCVPATWTEPSTPVKLWADASLGGHGAVFHAANDMANFVVQSNPSDQFFPTKLLHNEFYFDNLVEK